MEAFKPFFMMNWGGHGHEYLVAAGADLGEAS